MVILNLFFFVNYNMSSSYLLNLKINQLQAEVQGIGEQTGYFWNLISPNGLTIDGGDSASSIAAPNNNNTMYAYSDVFRDEQWSMTCRLVGNNSNMFFGYTKDITQEFSGASAPSLKAVDYGASFDFNNQQDAGFIVLKGINGAGGSFNISGGQLVKIAYDGTSIKTSVDDYQVDEVGIPDLGPIRLICGSYYGGQLNSITFSGTSSNGVIPPPPVDPTLLQVLTSGNNAGGLNIDNVGTIELSNGGSVLDTITLPPNLVLISNPNISIPTTGNFNGGQVYSIMSIPLSNVNYNWWTLYFSTFNFKCDVSGEGASQWVFKFWLTDTQGATPVDSNPLNVAYTTPNFTGTLNAPGTVLSFQNTDNVTTLYLNFQATSNNPTLVFNFEPINIGFQIISSICKERVVVPTFIEP